MVGSNVLTSTALLFDTLLYPGKVGQPAWIMYRLWLHKHNSVTSIHTTKSTFCKRCNKLVGVVFKLCKQVTDAVWESKYTSTYCSLLSFFWEGGMGGEGFLMNNHRPFEQLLLRFFSAVSSSDKNDKTNKRRNNWIPSFVSVSGKYFLQRGMWKREKLRQNFWFKRFKT